MTSLQLIVNSRTIEHIFLFSFFGFIISMLLTPLYTAAAYSGKWWKKVRTHDIGGQEATVFLKLHAKKHERNIPTMAGIIFVLSTIIVTLAGNLSRSQTWLPLAAMTGAGAISPACALSSKHYYC
jgi:phospho-N-acetylmuramoyl-pentapeptide-transferase